MTHLDNLRQWARSEGVYSDEDIDYIIEHTLVGQSARLADALDNFRAALYASLPRWLQRFLDKVFE